jgi:Zn-dependent alcohol dehydrogenase
LCSSSAEKDAKFVWQDVTLAEPEDNEVLVKIVACGICHTDLCIQNGAFPSPFPNVAGHEGSGKVEKVGSKVTRVQYVFSVFSFPSFPCVFFPLSVFAASFAR